MPQSLAQIYLHIVFSTKNRKVFLQQQTLREKTHAYLAGICKNHHCPALIIGGGADHVHVFCRLSRTLTIAGLLKELKSESSIWLKK